MANGFINDDWNSDGTASAVALQANTVGVPGGWVSNLALKYAASTLSISGNAAALSATRPAYVAMPSKASPGLLKAIKILADQGFIDDTGASTIINNRFGLTTGVAHAYGIPFFLYLVLNDAETAVATMCSRTPGMTTSPVVAEIGDPSSAVADESYSFFSFTDITEADYESNPCIMIGSFIMTMSASDDWTVTALGNSDGIGKFQEGITFDISLGQFGAAAGKLTYDNGGTAPAWTTEDGRYRIFPFEKRVNCVIDLQVVTAAGVGAFTFKYALPFAAAVYSVGTVNSIKVGGNVGYANSSPSTSSTFGILRVSGTSVDVINTYWTAADQAFFGQIDYPMKLA